jgi:hypothetical protein
MEDKKITLPSTEYFYRRAMIRSAEIKAKGGDSVTDQSSNDQKRKEK